MCNTGLKYHMKPVVEAAFVPGPHEDDIALVLSSHGIAMASRMHEQNKLEWFGRRSRAHIDDIQELYSDMSCEELSAAMSESMAEVVVQMSERDAMRSLARSMIQRLQTIKIC